MERLNLRAEVVGAARGKRLALATARCVGAVIEHDRFFLELRACPDALRRVDAGTVPLLARHFTDAEWWTLDSQLGTVRAAEFVDGGRRIEMIVEFGHSPRAKWIYRDLLAGHAFGCSVGIRCASDATDHPELSKPFRIADEWTLHELTILPAAGGRDQEAKVTLAHDLAGLLASMRATREAREEMRRGSLPEWYAEPLRRRLPSIAAEIAAAGHDPAAIEAALRAAIDRFIARVSDAVPSPEKAAGARGPGEA
jgi:hypothetical protein